MIDPTEHEILPMDFDGWYVFNVLNMLTGKVYYYMHSDQALLDWVLEPVPEDSYHEDGSFTSELPEGYSSWFNTLFTEDDAKDILPRGKNILSTIVLGGSDPLKAKAQALVSIMVEISHEAYLNASFPVHRTFFITDTKVKNREH